MLDPFGDHPVVMTGSHNLGTKASRANDDNLVILEGPGARSLAIAYAVNIIAIFQEYRWRTYVAARANDPQAWRGLQDDDTWQTGHLTDERDEMQFWIGGGKGSSQANQDKVAAATQAVAPTTAKRASVKSTPKKPRTRRSSRG